MNEEEYWQKKLEQEVADSKYSLKIQFMDLIFKIIFAGIFLAIIHSCSVEIKTVNQKLTEASNNDR